MEEIERNMNKMKISNRNLYFYDSSPGNLPFYKNNDKMSGINKINTRRDPEGFMSHEIQQIGQAKNMFILPFLMNIMNHIKLNIHSGENISELEKIYERAGSVNITNDFVNVVWDFTEVRVFFDKFSYFDHAAAGAFVRRALANVSVSRVPTFRNNTFNNRNIRHKKYHPLYDNDIIPLLNKTSLNREGRSFTLLHYASLLGLPKTVEFLLNNGANPFLQILTSSTPPLPPKITARDLTNEIKNIYLSKLNDDYVETFTDYAYNSRGPLRVTIENYEKTISNLEKGEENYTKWKDSIENTLKTDENRIIDGRNDVAKKITSFLGGRSKYSKKTRKNSKKHSIRKTKRKLAGTSKEEAARDLIDFAKNAHISDYYDKHEKDEYLMVKRLRKGKYVTIPPAPKKVFDSEEEATLFVYKYLNDNSLLDHNLLYLYDKDEIMAVMHYLKDKKMSNNGYYQYSSFKSKDDFPAAPAPAPAPAPPAAAPFVMPPPVGPAPPAPPSPFVMPNFQKGGVIYVDDENDKDNFTCPLSLEIMSDPVIAEDGFTYEREHIENWINTPRQAGQQLISPLTSGPMGINLIPNKSLKKIIDASVFDREPTLSASTEMQTENNETASTEMQTENNETASTEMQTENNETTPIETQTPQNIFNEIYAENEDAILDEALDNIIEDTFNENIDIVSEEEENKNIVKEILEEILTVDLNKKLQKRKKKNKKKASKQRKQQEMTKEEEVRKLVDKAKAIEAIQQAKLAEAKRRGQSLKAENESLKSRFKQEALGDALNINWNMLMEKCNLSMNGFLPNQMESAIIVDFYIHAAQMHGYAHVKKQEGAIEGLNIPYLIGKDAYQMEDLIFAKSGLVNADFIENELTNWMKDVVNAHVRLSDAANSASVETTSMLAEEIVSNYPTNYDVSGDMITAQIYEKTENHIRNLHMMNIKEEQQTLHYGAELRPEPPKGYSVRGIKRKTNNLETKFMDVFFFWGHCITLIKSMPKDELEKFANSDFYLKMTVEKMFHLVGTTPISEWDFGMVKRGLRVGSISAAAMIAAWIRKLLPIRNNRNELFKEMKKLEEVQKLIMSKVDANATEDLDGFDRRAPSRAWSPPPRAPRGGGPLGPIAEVLGGAGYGFTNSLHKLLTNQEYSNIISWKNDNDGNILIVLKDKFLVANEVCPRAKWGDFSSCARQFCNYGFKTESRKKIQRIGENELVFSNPKVKSIDDILTLERKLPQSCRPRVNSPTIDDAGANVLMQLSSRSTDMDNNEAANVLASIANISDENTEDLDRRISYLQNLNTNNEHSLKIALLIESLKNHVIDENEKNQIKQKQNELWQSLKEIELDNTKRKDILYKYMFEYLKRTIPQAKLNEGAKIAQSNFESIKRAQIHNRPTKPLTESEQKQADEETNAAISRGQQLAQDEDTNMEDVQSPNAPFIETPWWRKGGITDKALIRLHSEPVDGHMIEVYYGDHWKLGKAVRKKGRSRMILMPLGAEGERQANTIRQIVTQVDYIDGTSVDELLHRGDWKQRQNPVKQDLDYFIDNPKYWRYAKSNSRSQSGGVIYVDDENDKMRFECPISTEIMREPVIAEDGYSYEKEDIVNWIKLSEDKGNPITSPITGDNMGKTLIPNTVLKDIIENSIFDRQRDVESLSQIEDENKNKGIIIQYKGSKYGFIHTFDGIDNLFFHSSQLDNQIIVGDIVSFVIKEYKGKPTARNIKLIEPAWNRKTGVIVKYNNDKQYGFIEADINGMPHIFVHISEINQLVSVGDKVSFIIGKNMAGKAVAKKVKIINDEIGVEEEKKEDSEIPQLEQRLLMELIFERDRIMREREKVNSMIKSRK